MIDYYAHTPGSNGTWHGLEDHLRTVAKTAQSFANAFGAGDLAYWLGLWHDIGKFNPAFQQYLRDCHANPNQRERGPDHKAAGAHIALGSCSALALLIQGHHGGLNNRAEFKQWFTERRKAAATMDAIDRARSVLTDLDAPNDIPFPAFVEQDEKALEFFLRMLFSTLVDADFLDTEHHRNKDAADMRTTGVALSALWIRFEQDQQQFSGQRNDVLGQARHAMYQSCLTAAEQPHGFFRLAMPTGAGKTRSAMAFALRHAMHNGQQRIIVAVPFISITEQTAATYHSLFDTPTDKHPAVLEHHSGVDAVRSDPDDYNPTAAWSRLAAENWDAPIVVTTTVQLFESLFSSKTSRCRKLHRLAGSVIILDEAQALPPHLLLPILDGLRQLCANYGATVVISTATQPAFEMIRAFETLGATEIIPDATQWFAALKRVRYNWHIDQPLGWPEVATLMRRASQALTIVNTKKDALALLDIMDDPEVQHLSTLLCGAHRRAVIADVKLRLEKGQNCYLVSTQVIEAGVDLDFPVVLRAMGPLDSIIQAAGRCNREGRLPYGQVTVFRPEEGNLPRGAYQIATDITAMLVADGELDPDEPGITQRYFDRLFNTVDLDREEIQKLRHAHDYTKVAERFQMIDDQTEDVVVSYGTEQERQIVQRTLALLQRKTGSTRLLLRRIRPYTVSIPIWMAERYRRQHLITEVLPGLGIWLGKYDPVRGLSGDDLDRAMLVF